MRCQFQEDSDLEPELSPWNTYTEEKLLVSKIIAHNRKNPYSSPPLKKHALHLSHSNSSQFPHGHPNHRSLLHNPQKPQHPQINHQAQPNNENLYPFIRFRHQRQLSQIRNKTEPVDGGLSDHDGQERSWHDIFFCPRSKNRYGDGRLSKIQEEPGPSLLKAIQRQKHNDSGHGKLARIETKAFLNKNLLSRQHEKAKAARNENIVLPKIQICNINPKLL